MTTAPRSSAARSRRFASSTNGLDEYTADNFGGAMEGDLLAASYDDAIYRIQLNADGTRSTSRTVLFSTVGVGAARRDGPRRRRPVPGHDLGRRLPERRGRRLRARGLRLHGRRTTGGLDEDGDGYDNADEIDNGTNPCSPADHPPDADADLTSDLNDPDDDNDGLPDISDPFAIDAANGRDTPLPSVLTWDNDAPPAGGLHGPRLHRPHGERDVRLRLACSTRRR